MGVDGATGPTGYTGFTGPALNAPTSDTAPGSPADGDLWWNSLTGQLMIYYVDINGGQWVESSSGIVGPQGATGYTGYTGPGVSGTTNYVAKFTSGTAIGNSQIFDNGTSVGVNQASPAAKLDISGNYAQNIVAVPSLDVDCANGNYFTKTIAADSTFTFSNAPATRAFAFTLELTHTSGAVTWPAAVKWPANTAPTLTAGKTHIFIFVTDDSGTTWRGAALVDYVN
jgi:hypothetical protein